MQRDCPRSNSRSMHYENPTDSLPLHATSCTPSKWRKLPLHPYLRVVRVFPQAEGVRFEKPFEPTQHFRDRFAGVSEEGTEVRIPARVQLNGILG